MKRSRRFSPKVIGNAGNAIPRQSRQALYEKGYKAGYEKGKTAGYDDFEQLFDGTSIIIPTYNKKDLLLQCLNSIEACTPFPYELIVVDDGSDDGTSEALRTRSSIRIAVHQRNMGFAGAVNTGLMMAKGRTVLILNNDVLVAEHWLDNMLDCLNSSPDIGAVGPVTNYIGGEQQIEVPYRDLGGMREFAASRNRKDPMKWRETDRLVGFCLLMRREALLQTGFFDEGFRVGNYEDDDWSVRLRLLGWRLFIAGDAFIHHLGSETMRTLDARHFARTNQENMDYFHQKWGRVHERIEQMERTRKERGGLPPAGQAPPAEGCPVQVLASSGEGHLYWLERGMKYRIKGAEKADITVLHPSAIATRLSQRTLRTLPLGGEWNLEEAVLAVSEAWRADRPLGEGAVVRLPDGRLYQIDRGEARFIWSDYAAEAWGLKDRARAASPEELAAYPEGWPVLPPIRYASPGL